MYADNNKQPEDKIRGQTMTQNIIKLIERQNLSDEANMSAVISMCVYFADKMNLPENQLRAAVELMLQLYANR